MKKFGAFLLALLLLFTLLPGAAFSEDVTYIGTVNTSSLHLRKQPSASAKVVDTYKAGKEVTILENDGVWCKVQVDKKTGYMMTQYLDIRANYPHLGWGKTPEDGSVLNVRAGAGYTFPILQKTMSGCVLELIEEVGSWYRVRLGSVFGYVEKKDIQLLQGEYAMGFSSGGAEDAYSAASLKNAARECGNPVSMARSEGEFTFTLSYPELGVKAADDKMAAWVQATMRVFEADHQQNHAGTAGTYNVFYQALKIDDRYESVLLAGVYQVGGLSAETYLAVNVDTKTGKVLENERLFEGDTAHALFCLRAAVAEWMSVPTDGYSCLPEGAWLRYAVLGRDGVQVYLPKGLYLPASLGARRVNLRYNQVAADMNLDSWTISSHIRKIDPDKPMIALTFDDGPSEETPRILSVLEEYNARATFCVIGNKVETYANTVLRTVAGGNEIASHTWTHPKLTTLSVASIKSQLQRTNDAVKEITGGYEIKVLRPPYGSVNKNVRSICADMGMTIALWQVDTEDWSTRNANKTYNAAIKGAKDGVIILFHDLYQTTATAAEKLIPELVDRGYQLVTVSELLSFLEDGGTPGTVYTHVDPENRAAR